MAPCAGDILIVFVVQLMPSAEYIPPPELVLPATKYPLPYTNVDQVEEVPVDLAVQFIPSGDVAATVVAPSREPS